MPPSNHTHFWVGNWVQVRELAIRGETVPEMPLSDLRIRKAKQKDKPYRISDGLGLFLLIRPNGSKAWQFGYQFMGKEKLLSLGTYPILPLIEARRKRDEAKAQLADGLDPLVQRQLDRIEAETSIFWRTRQSYSAAHPIGCAKDAVTL